MKFINKFRKKSKLEVVVDSIVESLCRDSKGYTLWLEWGVKERQRFKKDVKRAVSREILSDELIRALAWDVIGEDGEIKITSHLFYYLARVLYYGDVKRLLIELQSVLKQ